MLQRLPLRAIGGAWRAPMSCGPRCNRVTSLRVCPTVVSKCGVIDTGCQHHKANKRTSSREVGVETAIEKSAIRKIYLRLLPFAVLSYILAYIDRINVSFAGLTMRGDLKLSATDFGFALGTFFLGYFIFEVPSNVIMEKVGARLWIARIMITWGLCAGLMALVYDTTSFSIVRFLLGVAEAGFFPGMLLYFTYWFPRKHHARIVS